MVVCRLMDYRSAGFDKLKLVGHRVDISVPDNCDVSPFVVGLVPFDFELLLRAARSW
jgi:hypothetical protein